MLAFLLLLAVEFSPPDQSVPNRQPQVATRNNQVALTFGAGNHIYVASSMDGGAQWTKPVLVPSQGVLSLGMRRGPRVALSGKSIVVSAILGAKGRGADGDLLAFRSTDGGMSWSTGKAINDVPGAAREGLHAMASGGDSTVFAVWLDLRSEGTRLYGSVSKDGGATWSQNRLVYESPSGSVCECCHPTAFVDAKGRIYVMFRNSLAGNRDMYIVRSNDGGRTFGAAEKLGSGSWLLNACPMDGGSFVAGEDGGVFAVWRREGTIYRSGIGGKEVAIGVGRQPVGVLTPRGMMTAWTEGKSVKLIRPAESNVSTIEGDAGFLSLAALPSGVVLVAGERGGKVFVDRLQ
jgi:hypothetical protein